MSWSQLVHPAQLSSGHSPHRRLNGGSTPAPGATTTLGQTYNLDSSMGLSSNGGFHSSDPSQVRLPSLHLSQFRTTLSPANFRPIRDPEHYEKLDQIGKGAYGTVFKARDRLTGAIVALKTMRFSLTEDGVPMAILREISLLKQLEKFDHPNIVRLLDITHGQRRDREMSLHLIFEHIHQDLASYIDKCPSPGLSAERIKIMMFQILSGVDFLHSHRIVHRDLKPQNLLVTKEGNVKLTDFGLARIYDFYTLLTSVVVTLWYRAPEVLMGVSYATPVDIWACGCIFAELFLRKPIFAGQYEMDQLNKIFDIIGVPSLEDWPKNAAVMRSNFQTTRYSRQNFDDIIPEIDTQAKDLLEKMLIFDPSQRMTASESLLHPYFSDSGLTRVDLSPTITSPIQIMRTAEQSTAALNRVEADSSVHSPSGLSPFIL